MTSDTVKENVLLWPAYNRWTDTVANWAPTVQKSFSFFFFVVFSLVFMRRHDMKTKFRSNASLRTKFVAKGNSSACNYCAGNKSMNLGSRVAICLFECAVVSHRWSGRCSRECFKLKVRSYAMLALFIPQVSLAKMFREMIAAPPTSARAFLP